MKKLLALFLTLALLVVGMASAFATASEPSPGYARYYDIDNRYTFIYPDGWSVIDRATVDTMIEAAKSIGSQAAATLETAKQQLEQNNMTILLGPDLQSSVSILHYPNSGIPDRDALIDATDSLKAQLSAQLPSIEFTQAPSLYDTDERGVYAIEYNYEMNGQSYKGGQYYLINGADAYIFLMAQPTGSTTDAEDALFNAMFTMEFQ